MVFRTKRRSGGEMLINGHTDRQTDRQTDRPNCSNPRCACAPRVNNCMCSCVFAEDARLLKECTGVGMDGETHVNKVS